MSRYGIGTAAHLGQWLLVVTLSELGKLLSNRGRRVRVVQGTDSQNYGMLLFMVGRREVCEARVSTRGRLVVEGTAEPPWSTRDGALACAIRQKLDQFLRYSQRPEAGLAWREVERKGVKVIEARRPGRVVGTIEAYGKQLALFVKGEKVGRASPSAFLLKQNAHLYLRE